MRYRRYCLELLRVILIQFCRCLTGTVDPHAGDPPNVQHGRTIEELLHGSDKEAEVTVKGRSRSGSGDWKSFSLSRKKKSENRAILELVVDGREPQKSPKAFNEFVSRLFGGDTDVKTFILNTFCWSPFCDNGFLGAGAPQKGTNNKMKVLVPEVEIWRDAAADLKIPQLERDLQQKQENFSQAKQFHEDAERHFHQLEETLRSTRNVKTGTTATHFLATQRYFLMTMYAESSWIVALSRTHSLICFLYSKPTKGTQRAVPESSRCTPRNAHSRQGIGEADTRLDWPM